MSDETEALAELHRLARWGGDGAALKAFIAKVREDAKADAGRNAPHRVTLDQLHDLALCLDASRNPQMYVTPSGKHVDFLPANVAEES